MQAERGLVKAVAEELERRREEEEGVEKRLKWLGVFEGMVGKVAGEVKGALDEFGTGLEKELEGLKV